MLRALVNLALRQRVVVVVSAAALVALGVVLASRSPLDVFPEFAPPLVEVQTEAPGMSSEAVEQLERGVQDPHVRRAAVNTPQSALGFCGNHHATLADRLLTSLSRTA